MSIIITSTEGCIFFTISLIRSKPNVKCHCSVVSKYYNTNMCFNLKVVTKIFFFNSVHVSVHVFGKYVKIVKYIASLIFHCIKNLNIGKP